jgi:hypothetical protein
MAFSQTVSQMICKGVTTVPPAAVVAVVCLGATMLTSCSSPPKPPSVDESTKRPVNAKGAVDLRACQGDLSRATLLVSEMARAGAVGMAKPKALPQPGSVAESAGMASAFALAAAEASANPSSDASLVAHGNLVAVVPFAMGSVSWSVEPADGAALVRRANDAAVIVIRGRTDSATDSPQETAVARRRAEAAAAFLQQAGVSKDKLRLTWQGAGDPLPGLQPAERTQSRRVEIEFYAAAPAIVSLRSGPAIGKAAAAASL